MSDIYRNGGFEPDLWTDLPADAPVPAAGHVILPLARFLADVATLPADAPVGVRLDAGDAPAEIASHLHRIALVAVNFPKFADGRGFSIARLLRERHGYAGPIRGVGDVLLDLLPLMERVGFSEFVVSHAPTRAALARGHKPIVPYFYQPGWLGDAASPVPVAGRPWLRRAI